MSYTSPLDDIMNPSPTTSKPKPTLTPVTIVDSNGQIKTVWVQVG